ncbi:ATP-binding protein [Persicobacter sp. CCB-QB2]|uniref:ATP-binding protein n=1 Tax=Persicobacter sp. CCB-QB2 TaxID=1561025 RepID=UPI0006A94F58|nr:ATP-binding protein [Persicobacter sp. CCB-QB2]
MEINNQNLGVISSDILLLIKIIEENFPDNQSLEGEFRQFKGIDPERIIQLYIQSAFKDQIEPELNPVEYFILLCAVAPHLYPPTFQRFVFLLQQNPITFAAVGGQFQKEQTLFYPTIETILFLLLGHKLKDRISFLTLFDPTNTLFTQNLVQLTSVSPQFSANTRQIYPTAELLALVRSQTYLPEYSTDFPASRISTELDWEDLVLPHDTLESLEELKMWMFHGKELHQHPELRKKIKPGYRVLFYGPSGTGKTLTASLIGKTFQLPVYRIDLSMVVSKWVGETEKNLKQLFDTAENKNWILFFDEADSIFGKRTQTNSSNDKYANQEVSYLLQRIEDFPGLIILASNLKSNIDNAFNRRFQSNIIFPMPDEDMRYALWEKAFPKDFPLSEEVDLWEISRNYELAGGSITNIIRYCVLKAMQGSEKMIQSQDLRYAIVREFKKSGKMVK